MTTPLSRTRPGRGPEDVAVALTDRLLTDPAAAEHDLADAAGTLSRLATELLNEERPDAAVTVGHAAAALYRRLVPHDRGYTGFLVASLVNLAEGQRNTGAPDDALITAQEAVNRSAPLQETPGDRFAAAAARGALADCLAAAERSVEALDHAWFALTTYTALHQESGTVPSARALSRRCRSVAELSAVVDGPNTAAAVLRRGAQALHTTARRSQNPLIAQLAAELYLALADTGRRHDSAATIAATGAAVALLREHTAADGHDRRLLVRAVACHGAALLVSGQVTPALHHLEEAVGSLQHLANAGPGAAAQADLATAARNLAIGLSIDGRHDAAVEAFALALVTYRDLSDAWPQLSTGPYTAGAAETLIGLIGVHLRLGHDDAIGPLLAELSDTLDLLRHDDPATTAGTFARARRLGEVLDARGVHR